MNDAQFDLMMFEMRQTNMLLASIDLKYGKIVKFCELVESSIDLAMDESEKQEQMRAEVSDDELTYGPDAECPQCGAFRGIMIEEGHPNRRACVKCKIMWKVKEEGDAEGADSGNGEEERQG